MNIHEVRAVVKAVQACCPAQKIDDFTANVWHPILADLEISVEQVILLVAEMGKDPARQWIRPADILAAVEAFAPNLLDYSAIPAPSTDPDDVFAYNAELRAIIAEMKGRPMPPWPIDAEGLRRQREMIGNAFVVPKAIEAAAVFVDGPDRPDAYFAERAVISGQSEEFLRRRAEANRFACPRPSCQAPVKRTCHVEGKALEHSPAHAERLVVAGLEEESAAPTRERLDAWLEEVTRGDQ